ncbi:putative Bracovirus particle protein MdBV-4-7 [Microplitis demolitor]
MSTEREMLQLNLRSDESLKPKCYRAQTAGHVDQKYKPAITSPLVLLMTLTIILIITGIILNIYARTWAIYSFGASIVTALLAMLLYLKI